MTIYVARLHGQQERFCFRCFLAALSRERVEVVRDQFDALFVGYCPWTARESGGNVAPLAAITVPISAEKARAAYA